MRTRMTIVACAASVAALATAGTSAAFTPLNTCTLVTKAEASRIIGHPVRSQHGETVQGCLLLWPGTPEPNKAFIDVYNDAQATRPSQSFQADQKRLHGTALGGLGNPAFYYNHSQLVPGGRFISRGVWVHHHGWVLQVTSSGRPGAVLSRNQLIALAKTALRRF